MEPTRTVRAGADDVVVTAAGYEQLCSELETLRTDRRRDVSDRLRAAREDGDPADNPVLFDLLEEQAQLERRIAILEETLAAARIAAPGKGGTAGVGTAVRLRDLTTREILQYELVGSIEANVGDGRVSVDAPVGRALVGGRAGETIAVEVPRGTVHLEILDVRSADGARQVVRKAA